MPHGDNIIEQLKDFILGAGASRAVVVGTGDIQFLATPACGKCPELGHNISRNPTIPPVDVLREEMRAYRQGVLFQVRVPVDPENRDDAFGGANRVHNIVLRAEEYCRANGAAARGIIATCCKLCRPCAGAGNPCRYPGKVRSALGAFGINVVETCARVGWPLEFPVRDHVDWTGLVLAGQPAG